MSAQTSSPVRVRFAPSPTGYLHVGGARTALFNWLFARKNGGQFLLRIEDTDKARSTDESTRAIFEGLTWLGLDWDEEVVYQGGNLERHRRDAQAMLDSGLAYRCFCTPAELDERRKAAEAAKTAFKYDRRCDRLDNDEVARRVAAGEPSVVRFRVPDGATSWHDLVHETISFPNKDIEDFVILRSDATPIYNMAVVSDDIAMRITHVMRGDDHISNTPKQILLYEALGATLPVFAHFPMIHGLDGKKLSKRHGATAVGDYQHLGILPEAMNNFLALMGWSPGGDVEVMSREEMITRFSVDGLLRKASVFDTKKLEWMNGQHLGRLTGDALVDAVTPSFVAAGLFTDAAAVHAQRDWFSSILEDCKERARTTDQLVDLARPFFPGQALVIDEAAAAKHWADPAKAIAWLTAVRGRLAALGEWSDPAIEGDLKALANELGVGASPLFQTLRVAVTGRGVGISITKTVFRLGREVALANIDRALTLLAERPAA
jgi:glutamyl-tRNA synthetase